MPRRSIAEQILNEVEIESGEGLYILIYSFGVKSPPPRFYDNLKRLEKELEIFRPTRGCIICKGTKAINVLVELARKYGAKYWVFELRENKDKEIKKALEVRE